MLQRTGEVRLDLEDWLLAREIDPRIDDAVNPDHHPSHPVCLAAQDAEVLTVEAHHEGSVRSRQDIEVMWARIRLFAVIKCPDIRSSCVE